MDAEKVARRGRLMSFDHGLFWPDPVPSEVEQRFSSTYRRRSTITVPKKSCKTCRTFVNVTKVVKRDNALEFYCAACAPSAPQEENIQIQPDVLPEEEEEEGSDSCIIKYRGIFFTLMSSICFSLTAVVVKYLQDYDPVSIALWRFQGSFLPAIPIMIHHHYYKKNESEEADEKKSVGETVKAIIMLFLRSFFTCNALLLNFYSLRYMEMGDALVILSSTPAFAYFFGFLFLGEPVGIVPSVMSLVTLGGVVFIVRPPILTGGTMDPDTLTGASFALGSTTLVTISYVLLRYSKVMHYSITTFCFGLWGTVENVIIGVILGVLALPSTQTDWLLGATLVILSFFGQVFIVLALQYEKTGPVTLIRTFDVVLGFIWQAIFFNIVPEMLSWVGAVIVIFGVVVIAMRKWIAALPEEDAMRKTLWFILK